jgi:hypothetical protein
MILALTTKQVKTEEDAGNVCRVKYASMNIIELILPDLYFVTSLGPEASLSWCGPGHSPA